MARLTAYKKKRVAGETPEPPAKVSHSKKASLVFVIHKHAASHLHYDLRLEVNGILKSWAVPKGPSLDPSIKRLAMMVEDHPFEYRKFEGTIPKGQYGGGTVMIWDEGTYEVPEATSRKETEKMIEEGLKKGHFHLIFHGIKLRGEFALVKLHGTQNENAWLLIKKDDEFATPKDVTKLDRSVKTERSMEEIASEES